MKTKTLFATYGSVIASFKDVKDRKIFFLKISEKKGSITRHLTMSIQRLVYSLLALRLAKSR